MLLLPLWRYLFLFFCCSHSYIVRYHPGNITFSAQDRIHVANSNRMGNFFIRSSRPVEADGFTEGALTGTRNLGTTPEEPLCNEMEPNSIAMESCKEQISEDPGGKSQLVGMGTTMLQLMSSGQDLRTEGIIKYIPEDFVVNEIDSSGNILVARKSIQRSVAIQAVEHERQRTSGELFLKLRLLGDERGRVEYQLSMFTPEDCKRLDALLDELVSHMSHNDAPEISYKKPPLCLLVLRDTENSKKIRTKAHVFIREQMPFLDSIAVPVGKVRATDSHYLEKFMSKEEADNDEKLLVRVFPRPQCITAIQKLRKNTDKRNQDVDNGLEKHDLPSMESIVRHLDVTDYSSHPVDFKERQKLKQFLHFNIHKRDRSTHEVTHMLCRALHRSSHDIFSAGNKDRRAITTQRFCIRRAKIEDLVTAMSQNHWLHNIVASDFQYCPERLRLGDLRGNSFWVTIRGVKDIENARQSLQSLKKHGFINYFGLQRFGSLSVGTHMVGAAMLRRDYEEVARLIINDDEAMERYLANRNKEQKTDVLMPASVKARPTDSIPLDLGSSSIQLSLDGTDPSRNTVKRHCPASQKNISIKSESHTVYLDLSDDLGQVDFNNELLRKQTRDGTGTDQSGKSDEPENVARSEHRTSFIERELMNGMARNKRIEDVLRCIPANVLSIYVHATQSLVFNHVLTERLKRYGMKPVPGDFVIRASPFELTSAPPKPGESQKDNFCNQDQNDVNQNLPPTVVGPEDVGKWSIYDVVLPLPGDHIDYPEYLRPVFEEVAQKHFGLSLEMFATVLRNLPPNLKGRERCLVGVAGGYRHIVARAHGLQYYVIPEVSRLYDTELPPAFMHLRNCHSGMLDDPEKQFQAGSEPSGREVNEDLEEELLDRNTVVVTCALPKSCYLTCALREVLTDKALERQQLG